MNELKFNRKRTEVKTCPCGKSNRDGKFAPFDGFDNAGYCHSCGKTFKPERTVTTVTPRYSVTPVTKRYSKQDFIPIELFKQIWLAGRNLYSENHFIQWLQNQEREHSFDTTTANRLIETYLLGNSANYFGWTLFPYIDFHGRVTDIKAIDYNPATGKRIREPNRCFYIGEKLLNNPDANLERSFFGENLLKGNSKPVKIFESEATAIYASVFYPESICIATGGKNGCRWTEREKLKVLTGRSVTLYPDIDAHNDWTAKAELLRGYGLNVSVSQIIKQTAEKLSQSEGIPYGELVKMKFDLRDILKYKPLPKFQPTEPEQWDSEDFKALDEMLFLIQERGISLPMHVRTAHKNVVELRTNQNEQFKNNLNTLIQFISLN